MFLMFSDMLLFNQPSEFVLSCPAAEVEQFRSEHEGVETFARFLEEWIICAGVARWGSWRGRQVLRSLCFLEGVEADMRIL